MAMYVVMMSISLGMVYVFLPSLLATVVVGGLAPVILYLLVKEDDDIGYDRNWKTFLFILLNAYFTYLAVLWHVFLWGVAKVGGEK